MTQQPDAILVQPGTVPDENDPHSILVVEPEKIREAPTEPDKLAKKWQDRIKKARKHWKWFYERCKHNRELAANFDKTKKADDDGFIRFRINLVESTIRGILPNLYARNPEISVKSRRRADEENASVVKFCDTLQEVLNVYLERAGLKISGKGVVRAALTQSYGVLKVCYQRDLGTDPIIRSRLQDAQDNLARIDGLASELSGDDYQGQDQIEALRQELMETIRGYQEDSEPEKLDGLVIDRVPTDQLIIDPAIRDFSDYPMADWMCQCVPMSREYVEDMYKIKVDGAVIYMDSTGEDMDRVNALSPNNSTRSLSPDDQVMVFEIWDRRSQRVYTMCDGCSYFLRDPDSPEKVGGRWYPFFLLPFDQVVDEFVAPSLVDLMEDLQAEHNETRDTQMEHKKFCKPGYIANADVDEKSITRFTQAELGEITILKNIEGTDVRSLIQPKQYPPIDQALYDTTAIRQDIEQVTGMQDAMRSAVVQPKTATEAQIMQQGLSGRVAAFRDAVEDFLHEIACYSAQILLQQLTEEDVASVMGQGTATVDPMTGQIASIIKPYFWPKLGAKELSRLYQIKIEAGSTGAPNKLQEQENWGKVVPTIMQAVQMMYQLGMQGVDTTPVETIITETCRRFDDRIDPKSFIPDLQPQLQQQEMLRQMAAQQQAAGVPQQQLQPQPQQPI